MKFNVGSQVWQEIPEEGWRTHQQKHCEYYNKDEDNCPKPLNNKNHQPLSLKFRQVTKIRFIENRRQIKSKESMQAVPKQTNEAMQKYFKKYICWLVGWLVLCLVKLCWVNLYQNQFNSYCSSIIYSTKMYVLDIGMMVWVFANGPGDLGSILGQVIPKTPWCLLA